MALGALTLSVTQGVQGRPFQATIGGLTTGRVEVIEDGSPGFSTVNGKVMSRSLPYAVSTVVLREYEPGATPHFRDTRIDITAIGRPVAVTANDGTITYTVPGASSSLGLSPASVPVGTTGVVAQLSSSLSGTVTFSKVSGASGVTIAASGAVTLSTALAAGGSAAFVARAQNAAGDAVESPLVLTAVAGVVVPPALITVPPEFAARWTPPFAVRLLSGAYSTDFDFATMIPAAGVTYYHDPVNGSDGADGLSRTTPKRTLSTILALAPAGVDTIAIRTINLTADFDAKTSASWNNVVATRNIDWLVEGSFRYRSLKVPSAAAPTWTPVSGAIYKTTITALNAASVVDLLQPRDSDGKYLRVEKVATFAAMVANSWWYDTANGELNVWAVDGRNLVGDTRLLPLSTGNNGRFGATNGRRISIRGPVDFIGGFPFFGGTTAATDLKDCTMYAGPGVSFQLASGAEDFGWYGGGFVVLDRILGAGGTADSIGYHANSVSTPRIFLHGVKTRLSGSAGPSDNAMTPHEDIPVVTVNCDLSGAYTRTMGSVDSSLVWMLGGAVGQPRGPVQGGTISVSPAGTSKVWLDGVTLATGPHPQVAARSAESAVYYRNMPAPTVAAGANSPGLVAPY